MVPLRLILTALASSVFLAQPSLAHSIKRNPVSRVSFVDDAVVKTPSHRLHSHSIFDLTFTLDHGRQRIRLALEPNDDLIHPDFAVTYLGVDGKVREVHKVPRTEHRVYRGDAFLERPGHDGWSKAGWARITVHRDGPRPVFDGAFRIDGDNHHIQTADQYLKLRDDGDPMISTPQDGQEMMVVWRDSDIGDSPVGPGELKRRTDDESVCEADDLHSNRFHLQSRDSLSAVGLSSLFGRQSIDEGGGNAGMNLISSIGSVSGCPTTKKVALVGIATDCNYWEGFNSMADLRSNVIGMVNKASQLYESTFKISLGIQNLTVSDKACPGTPPPSAPWNIACSAQTTINDRLNLFSKWRGQFQDANAYWTLLTRCATKSAVGLAWRGQLCRSGSGNNRDSSGNDETVAATNVVVRTDDTEWQIFAHESGHTFGAVHDCTSTTCPVDSNSQSCCPLASASSCDAKGEFIMNPTTAKGITQFSACSIGNICSGLKSNMIKGNCLTDNKNVKTIAGSQCGNGIVESGEDCDCGGEQGCKGNRCCDPKTCKFTGGAVCDSSNEDCCTPQCTFASSGTVCRASTGSCDPEEVCSGDRAGCPDDKHKNNGDDCGDGLTCASGQCTSRDLQCRSMTNSLRGVANTNACSDSGCMLSCTSPSMGLGQCITYNQNFLDGTSCGAGGRCSNGSCEGASTLKEIGKWIQDHKAIFIPVVTVVGGLVLIAIACTIFSAIRRRMRRRKLPKPPEMNSWPSSYYSGQAAQRQWSGSSAGPILDHAQHRYSSTPPAPAPLAFPNQWGERQRSMRYA